eukprot:3255082-Alexandrium_andersonii.AAC.1
METEPTDVLIHLGFANAFGGIWRDVVTSALCAALPNDAAIVQGWVSQPVMHYWFNPLGRG